MIVKYFAYFRNYAGCKEEEILLAPISAISLLKNIANLHGSKLSSEILAEDGLNVNPNLIFLINGRNIDFLNGKDSIIEQSDVVSLFPRIAGG